MYKYKPGNALWAERELVGFSSGPGVVCRGCAK